MLNSILLSSGSSFPQHIFRSWIFWGALVIMIIMILLYHNGYLGKRSKQNSSSSGSVNANGIRISYSGKGRSGYVHYQSREANFSMYYEFGGGNCVAWIDIPGPDQWEKATRLPLARRDEVLNAIGKQVVQDQVSSGKGYYKIEGNAINIYV